MPDSRIIFKSLTEMTFERLRASTDFENVTTIALPTSPGLQLDKWRVNLGFHANITAAIYKATTPIETVRDSLTRSKNNKQAGSGSGLTCGYSFKL